MKSVREYLLEQEPSGPTEFTDADGSSAYANNQGGSVTGGGRVQNYPVSAANMRWLRSQGGSFSFGYLRAHTLENLTKELLGTNLSASVILDNSSTYDTLGDRQVEEQNAASAYFNGEYQTIRSGYQAQYNAAIAAEDYEAANIYVNLLLNGPHVQEYDRLTDIYLATAAERSSLLTRMSNYIMGGKINTSDPYGLDHPELARQRRKQQELERNIEASLKQLAADNEALKSEGARRNIMALIDLGFDIATAIAILNVFAGPGDELSLQGLKQAVKQFFKKGATKGATAKAAQKATKPFQNASDDFVRAITDPKNYTRANDAVSRAPKAFKNQVGIEINIGGKTQTVNAADILRFKGFQLQSFQPSGKLLTESKKRVLKNIKKPYEVPELPKKYKMNFAGKYSPQNTPDQTASQITDALIASGNAKGQKWRLKDKAWQGYETSERMNIVYDKVGHGDQVMDMIVGENERKRKDRQLQEKLNIIAHEKALMKENPNYETPFNQNIEEQETLSADNDPLFKKVSKSLKRSVDYPKKPSKKGYPNDPPPKMVNGYHPDLVDGIKVSNYYNTLDPNSAKAMPKTGNDFIDMKVDAAKKGKYAKKSNQLKEEISVKTKKKSNWREEINLQESEWFSIPGSGPTNSASQSFQYGGEGGPTATFSGLGGAEGVPSTVTSQGETYDSPTYNQLAMQGYAPLLQMQKRGNQTEDERIDAEIRKLQEQIKQLDQKISNLSSEQKASEPEYTGMTYDQYFDRKKEIDKKWTEKTSPLGQIMMRSNSASEVNAAYDKYYEYNDARVEELDALDAEYKSQSDSHSKKVEDHYNAYSKKFDSLRKEQNALYAKIAELEKQRPINQQLDASQQVYPNLPFMGARVQPVAGQQSFNDNPGYVPYPNPNNYKPVSAGEKAYVRSLQILPGLVNVVSTILGNDEGSAATPADWALQYARGDYTPITKSPGRAFNQNTMELISIALDSPNTPRGSVQTHTYNDRNSFDSIRDTSIRNSLGQFNYRVTANGIEITDTFNFSGNTSIGALATVDDIIGTATGGVVDEPIQRNADKLVDIGYRSALEKGQNPADDKHGIPIKYTIPWSEVPAKLQNKLDPTQTISPIVKRKRGTKTESTTFNKLKKHR